MTDPEPFAATLKRRNIDEQTLRERLPEIHARWQTMHTHYHPESFLAQVRFEINAVRRNLQVLSVKC